MQETRDHTAAARPESDVIYSLRPLLTTYAYNITGSLEEARDLAQDAFLQYMQSRTRVENPKAYLVRTVINLSINRHHQRKRMEYPGEWLPEPVVTDLPDSSLLQGEVLQYSLMVLLEQLNARERAVFILREAFSYSYAEIAEVLDIAEANARQLLSRAKKQLRGRKAREEAPVGASEFLAQYLAVIRQGDTGRLEDLLKRAIAATSDGGGKVAAARHPVKGRKAVMALLMGIYHKFYRGAGVRPARVNHQPALLFYHGDVLTNCQVFTLENGRISHVYFIRNPEKLRLLSQNGPAGCP